MYTLSIRPLPFDGKYAISFEGVESAPWSAEQVIEQVRDYVGKTEEENFEDTVRSLAEYLVETAAAVENKNVRRSEIAALLRKTAARFDRKA